MARRDIDGTYVNRVMDIMFTNPTSQDIDLLVEAYAKIGYFAAVAESDANESETAHKMAQADAFLRERLADPKATVATLEAKVMLDTSTSLKDQTTSRSTYIKLRNLHQSIEQAINAVKYLGKNDGIRIG